MENLSNMLLLLSCFSCVRLCATPETAAHQASLPWDSPGKNTGVGCHFLLQCMKVKSESEVAQSCPTLVTPWTAAYQAPPPMGFSRQKYWSGVPLPSPIQPWHTPFPIWKQSIVPCPVLTIASWPQYRFLRRQVRWSGILISLRIFHNLLVYTQSKALAQSMKQKSMFFSGISLLSPRANKCLQFGLWVLCLFETQFIYLEVLGSHTAEA